VRRREGLSNSSTIIFVKAVAALSPKEPFTAKLSFGPIHAFFSRATVAALEKSGAVFNGDHGRTVSRACVDGHKPIKKWLKCGKGTRKYSFIVLK
jgi:hypothetical protein